MADSTALTTLGAQARSKDDLLVPAKLRVAITGAFLTGVRLAVGRDGFPKLQSALSEALSDETWHQVPIAKGGTFTSGGGFDEAQPLVIMKRSGVALENKFRTSLDEPPDESRDWLAHHYPGFTLTAAELEIEVYALGVAVVIAWFDVTVPRDTSLRTAARAIKAIAWLRPAKCLAGKCLAGKLPPGARGRSPITEALDDIAEETCRFYRSAACQVPPVSRGWLSDVPVGPCGEQVPEPLDRDHGRLLWLHPINVIESKTRMRRTVKQLAPPVHRLVELGDGLAVALGAGVFAPGIGWSAIVVAPESRAAHTAIRLTLQNFAYYALYMELDRDLVAVLTEDRWGQEQTIKQLDLDTRDIFARYMRVMDTRARLDSVPIGLGGDELAIWQVIAELQQFYATVEGVERKISVLRELAQRLVDQAEARRSKWSARILGTLTSLTVVTVATGLVAFFVGNTADKYRDDWWRFVIIAAAFSIALGAYLLAHFYEDIRRRSSAVIPVDGSRQAGVGDLNRPSGEPRFLSLRWIGWIAHWCAAEFQAGWRSAYAHAETVDPATPANSAAPDPNKVSDLRPPDETGAMQSLRR